MREIAPAHLPREKFQKFQNKPFSTTTYVCVPEQTNFFFFLYIDIANVLVLYLCEVDLHSDTFKPNKRLLNRPTQFFISSRRSIVPHIYYHIKHKLG